jgi:hypothetical protein
VRAGVDGLVAALRRMVRDEQATLLVLDSTAVVAELAGPTEFRDLTSQLSRPSPRSSAARPCC